MRPKPFTRRPSVVAACRPRILASAHLLCVGRGILPQRTWFFVLFVIRERCAIVTSSRPKFDPVIASRLRILHVRCEFRSTRLQHVQGILPTNFLRLIPSRLRATRADPMLALAHNA